VVSVLVMASLGQRSIVSSSIHSAIRSVLTYRPISGVLRRFGRNICVRLRTNDAVYSGSHIACILQLLQLKHTRCGEAVQGIPDTHQEHIYTHFPELCGRADPPELYPCRADVKLGTRMLCMHPSATLLVNPCAVQANPSLACPQSQIATHARPFLPAISRLSLRNLTYFGHVRQSFRTPALKRGGLLLREVVPNHS
jgi:hypothetical protein